MLLIAVQLFRDIIILRMTTRGAAQHRRGRLVTNASIYIYNIYSGCSMENDHQGPCSIVAFVSGLQTTVINCPTSVST